LVESTLGNIINSKTYCSILGYVQVFGAIFASGDGLGIAIIRALYVKRGTWIKYKYGELRLIRNVAVANVLLAFLMTILYESENISNRSVYNICKGYSQEFEVNIRKC
jgi:hypothetical protein